MSRRTRWLLSGLSVRELLLPGLLCLSLFTGLLGSQRALAYAPEEEEDATAEEEGDLPAEQETEEPEEEIYWEKGMPFYEDKRTLSFQSVNSSYAVLVSADSGRIIAKKNAGEAMYPASMTKIMTVLVASDYILSGQGSLSDTVEITQDIADYVVTMQGTSVGFTVGERPTVADCLWGTALPSGADAALALARYVAGTEEAFVELMNAKAGELGLTDTHFENPVGMYADTNVTTALEMAQILLAATDNPLAWTVLSTRQYTTDATSLHPQGITVTNRFLKRLARQSVPGIVFSAKTGYLSKAGSCAASYFVSDAGEHFICVTGKAPGTWPCIYDHAAIYKVYTVRQEEEEVPEEAENEEALEEAVRDTEEDEVNAGAEDADWRENG